MDKSRREREIWGLQRFLWEPEPRNARNRTSCDTESGCPKAAFGLSNRNNSTRLSWCRESKAACGATRNLRQPLSVPPKAFPCLPWQHLPRNSSKSLNLNVAVEFSHRVTETQRSKKSRITNMMLRVIYGASCKTPQTVKHVLLSLLGSGETWSFGVFFEVFSQSPKLLTSQQRKQREGFATAFV